MKKKKIVGQAIKTFDTIPTAYTLVLSPYQISTGSEATLINVENDLSAENND